MGPSGALIRHKRFEMRGVFDLRTAVEASWVDGDHLICIEDPHGLEGSHYEQGTVYVRMGDGVIVEIETREGAGGNIRIVSDFLFVSPDSLISASSEFGIEGVVEIESPDTDLNAGLIELPADFFDAATLLTQGCAPGADLSRLVVRKYEVLPDSPAALRVPPPRGLLNADAKDAGFALTRETLGPGFEQSIDCDGDG